MSVTRAQHMRLTVGLTVNMLVSLPMCACTGFSLRLRLLLGCQYPVHTLRRPAAVVRGMLLACCTLTLGVCLG